ncbi:uncharacterized protein [Montipora capricornis]|uniref:uncharacterized protein n=1 Tax=Montipora capricornis TaxID=246305 RepID=UPI0035F1E56D
MSYFVKDGFMFSFDLKSGYHHVDIAQEHQTFLGFSWPAPDSIKEIFYVFTVLPFGLSSAPWVFTKVLKPLEKYWGVQGLCIAIFLDHGWAIVQDRESCRTKARAVRADLCNAGFVVNEDKSVWEPTQVLDWLGITWNAALGTFKIVERRIVKIINSIDHIIEADFKVSARELSSFTGQVISTGPVVGNIGGRIMTRQCPLSTSCGDNWDSISLLDDYCKEELYFWKENMVNINTRYCFVSKVRSYFVYSDASATGGGAIIDFNNDFVCHKTWSENEKGQSSTWRELSVIEFSLQSFASVLEGSHVNWFTDSQVAAKIVEVGSMKLGLHKMARRIFDICILSGIPI